MSQKTGKPESFWQELKRRKVIRVTTVYAAAAFIILQLVDIIAQPLQLPAWTLTLVIIVLCIGLIITIIVSWIYDITPSGITKTKSVGERRHTKDTEHSISKGWRIATYVSGIIIVVLIAFNFNKKRDLDADISKLEKSIAVLPFINDSPSDSNQYFINGIMEEVLNNLMKISEFRVLSRTSTDQYKSTIRPTLPEIARKLGVSYIVEGSGQKYGNSYRLRVQLISGRNERHLWAHSYEKEIKETRDIFDVQNDIASSIAAELKATITPMERKLIEATPTTSLTAYDYYQKAREELSKYWIDNSDKTALENSKKLYKTALKYDPEFSLAYTGLAYVYYGMNYYKEYLDSNFMDSVLFIANKALFLDNQSAEAYVLKGYYYSEKGELKKAEEEFDNAIRYNPNNWMIYFGKGFLYSGNDLLKALQNYEIALSLNHGSEMPVILESLAAVYSSSGFFDKAIEYVDKWLELTRDIIHYLYLLNSFEYVQVNYIKAISYLQQAYSIDSTDVEILSDLGFDYGISGQFKESLKFLKKYINRLKTIGKLDINATHRIAYTYWQIGQQKEAKYYFEMQIEYCKKAIQFNRIYAQNKYAYYDLAGVYAFLGDKNKAYQNLRIFNQRERENFFMLYFIKNDPLFNSIRNEPEFQQIVKNVEAKYHAEHERVGKWLEEQGKMKN